MKLIFVFLVAGICALNDGIIAATRYNNPAIAPTPTAQPSLAQDLDEIVRMIPTKAIQRLMIRYLLNDAQFQAFVRIINSHDGYLTHIRFRSQPEVLNFVTWVRSQIILSGGELQSDESNESLKIIHRPSFWSQNVNGWQGFVNEFHLYYPEESIRMSIQNKVAQSEIFAEFVQRLKALKVAYDRVVAMPEVQRLTTALKSNGIDAATIDNFIRKQFGWQHTSNSTETGTQLPKN